MILAILAAATAAAIVPPPIAERTPNLYHRPSDCGPVVEAEVARQQVALKGRLVGGLQYAVFRELNGCSVPTPVGYHPSQAPGAADLAAKREDAPSNRR